MSLLKIPGFESWDIISQFLQKALFPCNTMYVWAVLQAWFCKLHILWIPTLCVMWCGGQSLLPKEAEEFGLPLLTRGGGLGMKIFESRMEWQEEVMGSKGTLGLRGVSDMRLWQFKKLVGRMEWLGKTWGCSMTQDAWGSSYLISQLRGAKDQGERW